jgi:hypothetical protein
MLILFIMHVCFNVLEHLIMDAYKTFRISQLKRKHADFFLADYMTAEDRTR